MGCIQSKPTKDEGDVEDLAYLSAFPGGRPSPSGRGLGGKDLELRQQEYDDSPSESSRASSEALFPSDDEGREPGRAGEDSSFKRTNKLQVGVLEGTTFLNNYIVVDTLGRGSFGKVKLCLNVSDDSLYAIKVVDKNAIKSAAKCRQLKGRNAKANAAPSPLADLRREVEVMRALDHPNLVKLYEVIEAREAGKLMMVMEYCDAGALVRPGQLTPDRRMPEAIAQFYFKQMAAGLAYLHDNGVVHGDVKPENILLSGEAMVKISDFGESQLVGESGDDTFRRTMGTPAFLAPEICLESEYKGRCADVWALGVSLYNFIFGELPFKGDSLLELYDSIADDAVPFPEAVPVSIDLQDLLLRTLCKDPDARISSAELLRHPWVVEEDLLTLMPTLFSEEGFGGFEGFGEGVSPRVEEGGSDADTNGGVISAGSLVSTGAHHHPHHHHHAIGPRPSGLPESYASMRYGGFGGPTPAPGDVAAAVFPLLTMMERAPTGAFHLGPQASIVGALMSANQPQNKLGAHPSGRLHYLAGDSMVNEGLLECDSGIERPESGMSSREGDSQTGSDVSDAVVGTRLAGKGPAGHSSGSGGAPTAGGGGEFAVDRSDPSAFTLMADRMQAAQAQLIGNRATSGPMPARNNGQLPSIPDSGAGVVDKRMKLDRLETIQESGVSGDGSSHMPDDFGDDDGDGDDDYDNNRRLLRASSSMQSDASFLGFASPLMSMDMTGQIDTGGPPPGPDAPCPFVPRSSGSLTGVAPFLQRDSVQTNSTLSGQSSGAVPVVETSMASVPFMSPFESDAFASTSFSTFATPQMDSSFTGASTIPEKPEDVDAGTEQVPDVEDADSGSNGEKKKPLASLLQKLSFSRQQGDSTAEKEGSADQQTSTTAPPPGPTGQPPIRWREYRSGQRIGPFGGTKLSSIYYIESGTVEVRWEASLPVSLSTVFSAALKHPAQSSGCSSEDNQMTVEASTNYLDNLDSVAFTAPHVANLAKAMNKSRQPQRMGTAVAEGARLGSDSCSQESSDALTRTLQQATARAEALMSNAAGGSLDNLLVCHRGASQFLGALSMLDPDFFANRWKASAVAGSDVVVIEMTREGLDLFLAQNPLAQVHLRASMARVQAEVTRLEALERIADIQRKRRGKEKAKELSGRPSKPQSTKSWRLSELGKAFGVTLEEAASVGNAAEPAADITSTATLDMFALVSRLRAGATEFEATRGEGSQQ